MTRCRIGTQHFVALALALGGLVSLAPASAGAVDHGERAVSRQATGTSSPRAGRTRWIGHRHDIRVSQGAAGRLFGRAQVQMQRHDGTRTLGLRPATAHAFAQHQHDALNTAALEAAGGASGAPVPRDGTPSAATNAAFAGIIAREFPSTQLSPEQHREIVHAAQVSYANHSEHRVNSRRPPTAAQKREYGRQVARALREGAPIPLGLPSDPR